MGNLIGFAALKNALVGASYVLRTAITTAGTVGTKTLCLGKRNVAVAQDGIYAYLCVFRHAAAVASTKTTTIHGDRYALADSGLSYVIVGQSVAGTTPVNSIVLGNVAVAVNSSGDLIVKDVTATVGVPDAEDVVFIGDRPVRVVRKGNNWYLGVKV